MDPFYLERISNPDAFLTGMELTAMNQRTLTSVLDEARDEGHEPMVRFLTRLAEYQWSKGLAFDLSMLRLWIRRPIVQTVELMVCYGDDRGGGKPSDPTLDRYELIDFRSGAGQISTSGTLSEVVDLVEQWALGTLEDPEPG